MSKFNKLIAKNKKAYFDYTICEEYECGITLVGTEVKSIRQGMCNLKDSFAKIENNEVFVYGLHISPYEKGNIFNKDPLRVRKLLLHKKEILKLDNFIKKNGFTLIPLSIYFSDDKIKINLGVCKGKKLYDKRESIKERDIKRNLARY